MLISALIRANGAHRLRAQARPTKPTRTVAVVGVLMKKVKPMQRAKRM